MKKEPIKPLMVEVSGGTAATNTLVFGLVQTTLRTAGFNNLKVNHPFGDGVSADAEDTASLLDVLHVSHPKMFDERVTVKQHVSERELGYDYQAPTHLVESFAYGVGEMEGKTHSTAEIHRTEQAKLFIEKVYAKYPRDPEADAREELEREAKFVKYMDNPQTRAMMEDLFEEKIDENELAEMRKRVTDAGITA